MYILLFSGYHYDYTACNQEHMRSTNRLQVHTYAIYTDQPQTNIRAFSNLRPTAAFKHFVKIDPHLVLFNLADRQTDRQAAKNT